MKVDPRSYDLADQIESIVCSLKQKPRGFMGLFTKPIKLLLVTAFVIALLFARMSQLKIKQNRSMHPITILDKRNIISLLLSTISQDY